MVTRRLADPTIYAASAESIVERVFGAVQELHDQVLDGWSTATERRERLQSKHIAQLRPGLLRLLAEHSDIVVGMGMIVAPGLLPTERRRLEWWQYLPGREQPSALQVDLNPESLGFYDYDTAEWFSVPRETGRRHIVGPYVDALGTDRYLLTFTAPVIAGGTFLGVVGADVPVSRFERQLLRVWLVGQVSTGGRASMELLIINSQGRVVVSNCAGALSGDLVRGGDSEASTVRVDLTDVPWQLQLSTRGEPPARLSC